MSEEEYSQLAGHITEKLDNTAEYEDWLIIQEHVEELQNSLTKEQIAYINLRDSFNKREQENQQLKEQIKELNLIIGIRQKRNLISKFDKEYDEEDKKKNPNRDYAVITPDAEEVYKRYYQLKEENNKLDKMLNKCVSTKQYIEMMDKKNNRIKQLEEQLNNPLKGIFANINDDMLLRDCGNLYAENKELKQENNLYKSVIDEVRDVINKMIDVGYGYNTKYYYATYKNSEFGCRAEIILEILDKAKINR